MALEVPSDTNVRLESPLGTLSWLGGVWVSTNTGAPFTGCAPPHPLAISYDMVISITTLLIVSLVRRQRRRPRAESHARSRSRQRSSSCWHRGATLREKRYRPRDAR